MQTVTVIKLELGRMTETIKRKISCNRCIVVSELGITPKIVLFFTGSKFQPIGNINRGIG